MLVDTREVPWQVLETLLPGADHCPILVAHGVDPVAAKLLAGCAHQATPPEPERSRAELLEQHACTALSDADVSALVGKAMLRPNLESDASCGFTTPSRDPDDGVVQVVVVIYEDGGAEDAVRAVLRDAAASGLEDVAEVDVGRAGVFGTQDIKDSIWVAVDDYVELRIGAYNLDLGEQGLVRFAEAYMAAWPSG